MSKATDKTALLSIANCCLSREAEAIQRVQSRLGQSFLDAVDILSQDSVKIITCGMGKSGHIAQKIAATLSSTGTTSIFLHAGEARHGDLGIYHPGDPSILISKSGSTAEIIHLIPILKDFNSPIVAIVGNPKSEIARCADAVLDASVIREADPLGLAPTASTIAALALGDALASALMTLKNFKAEDFGRLHPAGQLGRNLLSRVADVMKTTDEVGWVSPKANLKAIVIEMTRFPQGACCVVDEERRLLGIITDGDIRRILEKTDDLNEVQATDIMTVDPVTVPVGAPIAEALKLMEERQSQIYVLPVLDDGLTCCLGLIRLHDVYQPQNTPPGNLT